MAIDFSVGSNFLIISAVSLCVPMNLFTVLLIPVHTQQLKI